MSANLYIGNLSYSSDESGLAAILESGRFGVLGTRVMTDHAAGRSRSFHFVGTKTNDATTAVNASNGKLLDGRELRASVAREGAPHGEMGGR